MLSVELARFSNEAREWIPQNCTVLQEHQVLESLNHYIEVPCVVQWLLWYSAPTSLNGELHNHGVRHEQYNTLVSMTTDGSSTCLVREETTQEFAS